ncbi:hypothetical protein G7Z17_g749 [Cylindrodendrum hubeiense]|uniref:FAD-binding domain-containing protein n=1 Tax=Cylindrodendrum hubeiense TaxID=595255 RepID=A0A9P5HGD2_9HYPO|nr:hypothetical protein G7Z17_g749 [Cylindrodendrum hubeiense]
MAQNKPFRVVIAGGSVAGLTLANMLQANNIDFVVLEAYPRIAPQVGASLGLLPHGNRILDQLGLFDKIMELSTPVDTFTFRNDTGRPIASCRDVNHSFTERHGFPILFLDRQMVLQVLYDNIRDKSKIMTSKRVIKVELNDDTSTAITSDGSQYSGDMVVGADGIRSTVRGEMWRLANKLDPNSIDLSEAQEVPCDYNCIFGISSSCPGVKAGDMNSVFRDKTSYLIIGGLHGQAKNAIKAAMHEDILPGVKFSKLIENQISSSMTPLVEHVYKKWHFHRVMTVGDSCHKFHPIGGHGGNAAFETAATLTNLLVEALNGSSTGHLTTAQLDHVFRRVQELRHSRTLAVKGYSHEQQRTESLDDFSRRIIALHLLPFVDSEDVTFNFSCQIPASEKLEMLPVQRRERLIPFKDELLSEPKSRGLYNWLLIAFYVILAAAVYYGMWILPGSWGLAPLIGDVMTTGTFKEDQSFKLLRSYTGISALDDYFVFLAVIFMPGLRALSPSFRMLQVYFLGMIAQPIVIWTVESFRKRNAMTLLAIPSIWFTLFQSTGIGFFMPLYYAVYTWISDVEPYWWPLRRAVPLQNAKVLLAASLIGYFLPTILMFFPWGSSEAAQYTETFWQPSPIYVPLLSTALGAVYRFLNPDRPGEKTCPRAKDKPADVALLKQVYAVTGILGVLLHWYVLFGTLNSHYVSLVSVFVPDFSLYPMPLADGAHNIFLVDFWGFVVASYVWCVAAVWDLKRVGRTTANVTKAGLVILAAHFLLGPGAAMSAVWYWREEVMAIRIFSSVGKLHLD